MKQKFSYVSPLSAALLVLWLFAVSGAASANVPPKPPIVDTGPAPATGDMSRVS